MQMHLADMDPSSLAKLATAMAALTKVAADFDGLQAPRAVPEGDATTGTPTVDVHRSLAENLARVAANLAAR